MRTILPIIATSLAIAGIASSEVPRKMPITKYAGLWNNSPFTTKPIIDDGLVQDDVFEDYALAGVSPIKGGYRVTLMKRNDPADRTFIYSDDPQPTHNFKILSVERDPEKARSTVVHMMSGSRKGTVTYDEKLLTIAAPKPPQANPNNKPAQVRGRNLPVNAAPQGNVQGGAAAVPANSQNPQTSPRAPRPRVIGPPPTSQPAAPNATERPDRRTMVR